jgi:hypothetical protein
MLVLRDKFPNLKKIILQTDNAACLADINHIPFLYHLNKYLVEQNLPVIETWINTEAQTGKTLVDTHFSFVKIVYNQYVADGNNITTPHEAYSALTYDGGIAGTTVCLVDLASTPKSVVGDDFKSKHKTLLNSRKLHQFDFTPDGCILSNYSGVSDKLLLTNDELEKYKLLVDLPFAGVKILKIFSSQKAPLQAPAHLCRPLNCYAPEPREGWTSFFKANSNYESRSECEGKYGNFKDTITQSIADHASMRTSENTNNMNDKQINLHEAVPLKTNWAVHNFSQKWTLSNKTLLFLCILHQRGVGKSLSGYRYDCYTAIEKFKLDFPTEYKQILLLTLTKVKSFFCRTNQDISKLKEELEREELLSTIQQQARANLEHIGGPDIISGLVGASGTATCATNEGAIPIPQFNALQLNLNWDSESRIHIIQQFNTRLENEAIAISRIEPEASSEQNDSDERDVHLTTSNPRRSTRRKKNKEIMSV